MLFTVQQPGDYNTAEWDFFFFFILPFIFGSTFSYQKKKKNGKKKDFVAARLATISATRWTGNKLFLRVALEYHYKQIHSDSPDNREDSDVTGRVTMVTGRYSPPSGGFLI